MGVPTAPRLVGPALLALVLLASCSSGPEDAYLDAARDVAPARYDEDAELVNAGRAACLQQADGKSPAEIVESVVFWAGTAGGQVDRAEAGRLVEVALQHCPYLTGPEAKAVVDEAIAERAGS